MAARLGQRDCRWQRALRLLTEVDDDDVFARRQLRHLLRASRRLLRLAACVARAQPQVAKARRLPARVDVARAAVAEFVRARMDGLRRRAPAFGTTYRHAHTATGT